MPTNPLPKKLDVTAWIMQGLAAIIFMIVGAFPKLTGDPSAQSLFEQVGLGNAGMYATGVAELAAAALLLIPKTAWIGGALGVLVMIGAIGSHLFTGLGIVPELPIDGEIQKMPAMFPIALLTLGLCLGVFSLRKLHPGGAAPAPVTDAD